MSKNNTPQRPTDPINSFIWDMAYGPASQNTPFNKLGEQIDGLKSDLKSLIEVSHSINEMNKTVGETNKILKEMNNGIKALVDRLK